MRAKRFEKISMRNIIEGISYKFWKYGLKIELFYIESKAHLLRKIKVAKNNESSMEIPEEIEMKPEIHNSNLFSGNGKESQKKVYRRWFHP